MHSSERVTALAITDIVFEVSGKKVGALVLRGRVQQFSR